MLPSSHWVPPGEQDPLGDISVSRSRSQDPASDIPSRRLPHCWVPRSSWELLWYRCLTLSCSRRWRQDPTATSSTQTFPPPVPRGQSPSEDSAVDHWPRRSCFPRTPRHHVGSLHKSGRAMKYYTRFRFISADRLASFAEPIKALNDAIHQRADRTRSDRGPGNFALLGPSANSLSDPCFH